MTDLTWHRSRSGALVSSDGLYRIERLGSRRYRLRSFASGTLGDHSRLTAAKAAAEFARCRTDVPSWEKFDSEGRVTA